MKKPMKKVVIKKSTKKPMKKVVIKKLTIRKMIENILLKDKNTSFVVVDKAVRKVAPKSKFTGGAWVFDIAKVFGNAKVYGKCA